MVSKVSIALVFLLVAIIFSAQQVRAGKKKKEGLIIVLSNGGCGGGNIVVSTGKGGKKGSGGGNKIIVKGGEGGGGGGCGCSSSCGSCGGDHSEHVQHIAVPVPIHPGHHHGGIPVPIGHHPHHPGIPMHGMMSQPVPSYSDNHDASASENHGVNSSGDSNDQEPQASSSENSPAHAEESDQKESESSSSSSSSSSGDKNSNQQQPMMAPLFIPMNAVPPPWFHGSPVFMDPSSQHHLSATMNQQMQFVEGYPNPMQDISSQSGASPSSSSSQSSQSSTSSSSPSPSGQSSSGNSNQAFNMDSQAAAAHFMAQTMNIPAFQSFYPQHMDKGEFAQPSNVNPMYGDIFYPGSEFFRGNPMNGTNESAGMNGGGDQSKQASSQGNKRDPKQQGSRTGYLQPIISSVQKLLKVPGPIRLTDIEQGLMKQGQRMKASYSQLVPIAITNYTAYLPSLPSIPNLTSFRAIPLRSNGNNNRERKPGNRRSRYLESLRVRLKPVAVSMDSVRMAPVLESLWKNIRNTRTSENKPRNQANSGAGISGPGMNSNTLQQSIRPPNEVVMQQYLEQILSSKWWEWPSGGLLGPNLNQYST